MVKKLVKRDERVVFFFGKRRKLNYDSEFKVGQMIVRVRPEPLGRLEGLWHAMLRAYDTSVIIHAPSGRSPAAAVKKLERRVDLLYRALNKLYENYDA